jgi:hypothetical protein
MIRLVMTDVSKMRVLDGIGFPGSDQSDGRFCAHCRYRGRDSEGFPFVALEIELDVLYTCRSPGSQTI